MKSAWKSTVAAVALAATFAVTSSANAQYYYDPYYYGGYDYGYSYPSYSYGYSYPSYGYGYGYDPYYYSSGYYYPTSSYGYGGYGVNSNVLGGALLGLGLGYALFD